VRLGYGVTVFEALPVPGGMLWVGIPSYRLPRTLVQREIDEIVSQGVELRMNARVKSTAELLEQGFKAVFVATGAHSGRKLPIPGADHPDVLINTSFLREVALGNPPKIGQNVLVIGGGNVAMDCARTARRLGQPAVSLACLEARDKMPAHDYEIAWAEEEGIEIHPSVTFKSVEVQDDKIVGVRCERVRSMVFDADGRLTVENEPNSEHIIPCDSVIFAIGQGPERDFFQRSELDVSGRGTLVVDPETLASNKEGVFGGGDAVTGTTFVVDAIAAGHKAATSIDRYLRGEELKVVEPTASVVKLSVQEIEQAVARGEASPATRHNVPSLPVPERFAGDPFKEVETGFG
jgi:formate dehydrogenase beta subunit